LVLAGMIWYIVSLNKRVESHKPASKIEIIAKKQIETEAKQISKEVSKNGLTHTIYKMVKEIDQSAVDKINADLLDTIDKLNITRDKLRQVSVIAANLDIKNQKLERKVTDLATTYIHTDDHFRLAINVPKDSLQSATFNAGYDADLITTQYNKTKWWIFKDNYLDIYSNDPRFTIKGARTLTVKPTQPAIGFQARTKIYYSDYNGPSAGPGVKLKLGKLDLEGDYQYYTKQKGWSWGAGATYNIGGF